MPMPAPLCDAVPDLSILIVSYNTREVLGECLRSIERESSGLEVEICIVDNGSSDGSAEMIEDRYPSVRLLRSGVNLGFGGANNKALEMATGRYILLLNSDAFLGPDSLWLAIEHMDRNPRAGLGGAKLVGRDSCLQPSSRMFPNPLSDLSVITGLASRFPRSRLFGYFDRTWADPSAACEVDWVPGAFSIIRAEALRETGFFDPAFFLYSEEVDLCRRIRAKGWQVWYWPDIAVVHVGGESARQVKALEMSASGAQLILWRMRSTLLYYRKHHGAMAWAVKLIEVGWYECTALRNALSREPRRKMRALDFKKQALLMRQAWRDTRGGRESPPGPW